MFTGSTDTAQWIARELAARGGEPAKLIAETGGQNAMIIDSTALLERVVDDVISSGFKSAGQRCSALRVLFVQEELADNLITMLTGAMQELSIGDPSMLSTDVGPLIDARALSMLQQHQRKMEQQAKVIYQPQLVESLSPGYFYAPILYEIEAISLLEKEVFGPAVHVVRYAANQLDRVIDDINSAGYGLTLGIHTRIESKAEYIARHVKVGNVYINRNMIGAVVGVQPFGGCGMSGTGPKAGGPHYLAGLLKDVYAPEDSRLPDGSCSIISALDRGFKSDSVTDDPGSKGFEEIVEFDIVAKSRGSSIEGRVEILHQYISSLRAREQAGDDTLFNYDACIVNAANCIEIVKKAVPESISLPGPTGESNELYLEPRGNILCLAVADNPDWIQSVFVGLLTGNRIILGYELAQESQVKQLVADLIEAGLSQQSLQPLCLFSAECLKQAINSDRVDALVVRGYLASQLMVTLRQRDGALIPMISGKLSEGYVHGFMREKTITIDTTAAGGNATLLIAASKPSAEGKEPNRIVA
jgi:RHH-type proline utilization regulon transcriptional repressor/proline dehydrogenase/delta 1-pyrroline-5-carboxylate dehydrogenase